MKNGVPASWERKRIHCESESNGSQSPKNCSNLREELAVDVIGEIWERALEETEEHVDYRG